MTNEGKNALWCSSIYSMLLWSVTQNELKCMFKIRCFAMLQKENRSFPHAVKLKVG